MPKTARIHPLFRSIAGTRRPARQLLPLPVRISILGSTARQRSRQKYDQLLKEYLAAGKRLPDNSSPLTVTELILFFWKYAKGYYQKNGKPTSELGEYKCSLQVVRQLYSWTAAAEFGPKQLKTVREEFIKADLARKTVNKRVTGSNECSNGPSAKNWSRLPPTRRWSRSKVSEKVGQLHGKRRRSSRFPTI